MLIKDYYSVESISTEGESTLFRIHLNPACTVYEGHFPEKAVSPGVCNIQMVKECAEHVAGTPLLLSNLQQCRLTTLITPDEHPHLEVRILLTPKEDKYTLKATIGQGDVVFLELKGELTKEIK